MKLFLREFAFVTIGLTVVALVFADEPAATLPSATGSHGERGSYRWDVKTDHESPPDSIAADHKVKPSDVAKWPEPRGKITSHTPRSGRELEWWEVTGRIVLGKIEADGDIHLQLVDADNPKSIQCVVEIPVKQHPGESPWDEIRVKVFNLFDTVKFPLKLPHALSLNAYTQRGDEFPVVRVEGKAFFDGQHRQKSGPANRRAEPTPVAVWEPAHPVMLLEIVP